MIYDEWIIALQILMDPLAKALSTDHAKDLWSTGYSYVPLYTVIITAYIGEF